MTERKQAEEITAEEHWQDKEKDLIKSIGLEMMTKDKVYFPYEMWEFMESYVSLKVAEATEMYPKEFIVWLVNIQDNPFGKVITGEHDALYVNFYEGSERKYTLDELSEYWKQNIRK